MIGVNDTFITYTYDKLYRLTNANYSDGRYFTYAYDAVGNRLSELTQAGTITYTYDAANRLTNAGGIAYSWNANGNLLADGVYIYTYGYNGLDDRMRQVCNGVTTSCALGLNAGLTQMRSALQLCRLNMPSTPTVVSRYLRSLYHRARQIER